jgi:hypothetical protein
VHVGCEWSQEELNERLRQNDPNAGWGAAKEKKKPPYSDAKRTQNSISWEYDFLCGNKGDMMKESNDV